MQKLLIFTTVFMLIGCAHKIDIQQGNVVSEEVLSQLRTGMDARQVTAIMGTPMLQDPFHPDRWDYFYSQRSGRKETVSYGATLYFDNNRLQRIERYGSIPQTSEERPDPEASKRM